MNLNKFKKNIRTINPERGLKDLVGAKKAELRDQAPGTVRVNGRYISGYKSTRLAGRILGIGAYITAWITGCLMLTSSLLSETSLLQPPALFLIGFLLVHGGVILADGLQNSNAPWARKAVIIFWSMAVLTFVISLIS